MRRRRIVPAASSLLLLAGVACSAPASQDAEPAAASTTAPTVAVEEPEVSTTAPTSPLAAAVEPLGSAVYDPAEHQAPERVPVGLALPSLGVDGAPVLPVGVEPDGEMEIPPADEVGWYRFGAAPGEAGSAVLAAHVAYDGVDGVFRNLDRLRAGDEVEVVFDDGARSRWVVTEVSTHRKDALPDELFDRSGPERLVLITCGGQFNPSLRSYDSNVVAHAVPA